MPRWFEKLIQTLRKLFGKEKTTKPTEDKSWRRDLAEVKAVDGVVTWKTRNVKKPGGRNKNGGWEWIIARLRGDGFDRVLIMTMGGSRPPARIFFETVNGDHGYSSNKFPVPLESEHEWMATATGGDLEIKLNGRHIWKMTGSYTLKGAVMNGYANRGMDGEWSEFERAEGQ